MVLEMAASVLTNFGRAYEAVAALNRVERKAARRSCPICVEVA
jgi:hypothetical protein